MQAFNLIKQLALSGLLTFAILGAASADEIQVAVAANFSAPAQQLAAKFEQTSGHHASLVFGSTGKFAAQIHNGAPFDVLLAADAATPKQLQVEGYAVPGQSFTYAIGKLVLFSSQPGVVDAQGSVLKQGQFQRIALADPKLAPYGAAGMQTLQSLHLLQSTLPKVVLGESITQAFQFVSSGNAELGFVALSQVINLKANPGSYWIVPPTLYSPITQDAVLLKHGEQHAAAQAFLTFLKSDEAKAVIRSYGYALGSR